MTITVKNGWVFSKREDLYIFLTPFIAGWMVFLVGQLFHLQSLRIGTKDSTMVFFALLAFLDAGHLFSTVFKSYLDERIRREKRFLLYVTPLLIYILLIALYHWLGMRTVLILFGYYNVYHIMRQQYGWVNISSKKANENNKIDYWLDKVTIYSMVLVPLIWIHFTLPANDKQFEVPKSKLAANLAIIAFLAIFITYFIRQWYKAYKQMPINFSKIFQVIISFLTWGSVIVFQSPLLLAVPVLLHNIPYLGIVFKTSPKEGNRLSGLLAYRYSILLFALFVAAAGVTYAKTNNFIKSVRLDHIAGIPKEYFLCALLLFPIMHFVIDGVIWKRKHYNVQALSEADSPSQFRYTPRQALPVGQKT